MNTKSSTKNLTRCCCPADRSHLKVSLRFQVFPFSSITPVIPKAQTTRHYSNNQAKIQEHPKWNSSIKLTTNPVPGTKMRWENLKKGQPFRAKPLPASTYEPFRPVLSKDRTSVIDRRSKKVLQELAKREVSAKENTADEFKPEPFRAKLLPASTYKPFRPLLSKDRQPIKRTAVVKKPMILQSQGVNDATESASRTEQHPAAVDRMSAREIRDKSEENITIVDEGGNALEPDNQPDGVESDEAPIMSDNENLEFEEDVDQVEHPDVEESEKDGEPETTEESEIVDEEETAEELDNDVVHVTHEVGDAPIMSEE